MTMPSSSTISAPEPRPLRPGRRGARPPVTVVERAPGVVEQLLEEQDAARRDGTLEVGQPIGEREKALGFCANRKPVDRLGAWKQAGVGVVDQPAQLVRTVQSPLGDNELGGAPREP